MFCAPPPTPPPWNRSWVLTESNPSFAAQIDPDNGQCDAWVINAHNVEDLKVTVVSHADTPEKCVGTLLTTRRYARDATSWNYVGAASATGVWTIDGCRLPSITWNADTTSSARIHITTRRSYTSGQYTVLTYGLPFVARASLYVPPPGPN